MKDLHVHTKYSDGQYDEYQILVKLMEAGIDEFAICDHDTLEGSQRVYNLLKEHHLPLKFHTGVEISARLNDFKGKGVNIHLLVRDFKFDDPAVHKIIEQGARNRMVKIYRMLDFVEKTWGVRLPKNEVEEAIKKTKSFGKPHVYTLLSKHFDIEKEEYYRAINKLNNDDIKVDTLWLLHILKNSPATTTLAHPIEYIQQDGLSFADINDMAHLLAYHGLYGIETMHSKHTLPEIEQFAKIAKRNHLVQTMGSDFHGEKIKENVRLGVCFKEETNPEKE